MLTDQTARLRALQRYRLMFKTATVALAAGIVLTVIGIGAALTGHEATLLTAGLLLFSMSGLNAYKFVLSTSRLLETERE